MNSEGIVLQGNTLKIAFFGDRMVGYISISVIQIVDNPDGEVFSMGVLDVSDEAMKEDI